jgi:hypothetical protein
MGEDNEERVSVWIESGAPSGAGRSILIRVDRRIDNAFLGGEKRDPVLYYTTTTITPQYHPVSVRVYTRESFTYNNFASYPDHRFRTLLAQYAKLENMMQHTCMDGLHGMSGPSMIPKRFSVDAICKTVQILKQRGYNFSEEWHGHVIALGLSGF